MNKTLPWFRLYSEFAKDPKIQSMSEVMQRRLIMVFCLQCSEEWEALDDDELLFSLGLDDETFHETIALFQKKGFLDKNRKVKNWMKRQFKSDTSTNRVKKFREKQKVKEMKQQCNVSVTPPETETETETETERGCDFDLIIDLYNQVAQRHDLPIAQKLTNARKSKIRARLKDCGGMDGWKSALEKLERSDFCLGKNNSGWRADLDFILQESSFTKLMEGTYDNTNTATSKTNRAKEAIIKSRGDSLNAYPL